MVTARSRNGGTLYYLQPQPIQKKLPNFQPRVQASLDIEPLIPTLRWHGRTVATALRQPALNFNEEIDQGQNRGTCRGPARAWMVRSYANTDVGRLGTVVFLQGASHIRPARPPKCRRMYRNLYDHQLLCSGTAGTTSVPDLQKVIPTELSNK